MIYIFFFIITTIVFRPADVCLPFTVKVGEGVGRYVVATRDIKAGQVVIVMVMMICTMILNQNIKVLHI